MFRLRDFPTITADLLAEVTAIVKDITDYSEGAVLRSFLEAVAMELQRFDVAAYQGIREAIEVGTYKNFDFFRLPAVPAAGKIKVVRAGTSGPATWPAGRRVRVPGSVTRVYTTLSDAVWADRQPVAEAAVRCVTSGTVGNTPANTVVEFVDPPTFAASVSNPAPFLSGVDQESDADRRARFRTFVAGLSRGTVQAIEFAARTAVLTDAATGAAVERVTSARVNEPFLRSADGQLGRVEVYVDNGSGTASAALLDLVGRTVRGYVNAAGAVQRGWIAAGVDLAVFGVRAAPVDVVCRVTVAPGFASADVQAAVRAAVESYLAGLQVFEVAVLAKMVERAMEVEGVDDVAFTAPVGNTAVALDQRATPGTVVVSI